MAHEDSTREALLDELSAYLDGELDAEGVRRVEERLARDVDYRNELHKLERTWDLLDGLHRAAVGEQFTKSTLEMVALSASQEAEVVARELPRRRRRQRLLGIASMLAALVVGFVIGTRVWPDPNEPLLEDLPVLENLELFYRVDDIEFLRMLDQENLFPEGGGDGNR
jgi:anti-sigma factor RsiW